MKFCGNTIIFNENKIDKYKIDTRSVSICFLKEKVCSLKTLGEKLQYNKDHVWRNRLLLVFKVACLVVALAAFIFFPGLFV